MFVKCAVVVTLTSHWLVFSVSDLCQQRRHCTTQDNTIIHKLADLKLLNYIIFNPSLKRMSYVTLASIKHRTLGDNVYKYCINSKIRCVSPDISTKPLETNKPLIDRGLGV